MKFNIILFVNILLATLAWAQDENEPPRKIPYPEGKCYMMRLYLRDKADNQCKFSNPTEFLSAKAIERRHRQKLEIDSTDLPVSRCYEQQLEAMKLNIISRSRWNNTVVVRSKSMQQLKAAAKLPFVEKSKLVWRSPDSISVAPHRLPIRKAFNSWDQIEGTNYGVTYEQTSMLHGESLHDQGYMGEGMMIAVLDGGFMNVDRIPAFSHTGIVGTADMVYPPKDIYKEVDHGTKVFSVMGVNIPTKFVGTAPAARYWLIRCEDNETEQLVEEDYWAAAAELADSAGVDIISSSLGYHDFDHKDMVHKYAELDGHRTLISSTASMCAGKGIVLVVSAGNDGMGAWKKINPPADAEDILTVGAVIPQGTNAAFSSIGPTADGRIKPDVMACGSPASVVTGRGSIMKDIGTSFAAPQVAGLVACLWQKYRSKTAKQIMDMVRRGSSNAESPDNIYGYGVPDFRL